MGLALPVSVQSAVRKETYTLAQYVLGEVEPERSSTFMGRTTTWGEREINSHVFFTEQVAPLARAAMEACPGRVRVTVGVTANYQGGVHGPNPVADRPADWEGIGICREQTAYAAHNGDQLILVGGAADAYEYAKERGLAVRRYSTCEAALAALNHDEWGA